MENTKPIKKVIMATFADYGVDSCQEGQYGENLVATPSPRIYDIKRNYVQYIASHYKAILKIVKTNTIVKEGW